VERNAATQPQVCNKIQCELEIWGRAQLEAARSPKSDWKLQFMGLVGRAKI